MNPEAVQPRFYDVRTFGQLLGGLSPWTIRAWAYQHKIASAKIGSRLMIPAAELERLEQEAITPARPEARP